MVCPSENSSAEAEAPSWLVHFRCAFVRCFSSLSMDWSHLFGLFNLLFRMVVRATQHTPIGNTRNFRTLKTGPVVWSHAMVTRLTTQSCISQNVVYSLSQPVAPSISSPCYWLLNITGSSLAQVRRSISFSLIWDCARVAPLHNSRHFRWWSSLVSAPWRSLSWNVRPVLMPSIDNHSQAFFPTVLSVVTAGTGGGRAADPFHHFRMKCCHWYSRM